jgi:hypothetical protein
VARPQRQLSLPSVFGVNAGLPSCPQATAANVSANWGAEFGPAPGTAQSVAFACGHLAPNLRIDLPSEVRQNQRGRGRCGMCRLGIREHW